MTDFDLDAALDRYGKAATPDRLARLEDAVFTRIDAAAAAPSPMRAGMVAALAALAIGLTSVGLSPGRASAPVLDDATALAPSTLLSGLLR